MLTHEQFVHKVREVVAAHTAADVAEKLRAAKLLYGIGDGSYRGICHYQAWKQGPAQPVEVVEIAATGEENPVQLAGTTIHELGHVVAGSGVGHGKEWKEACQLLGLRLAKAVGHVYLLGHFAPAIRSDIAALIAKLEDGNPAFRAHGFAAFVGLPVAKLRPCPMGIGVRGGKTRGVGTGSRLRLWECDCQPKPVKVRVASDTFNATCNHCGGIFHKG